MAGCRNNHRAAPRINDARNRGGSREGRTGQTPARLSAHRISRSRRKDASIYRLGFGLVRDWRSRRRRLRPVATDICIDSFAVRKLEVAGRARIPRCSLSIDERPQTPPPEIGPRKKIFAAMSIPPHLVRRHSRRTTAMMANAGKNSEGGIPRGSLLEKIKSWDEAMQWSERHVKAEGDGV